MASAQSDLDWQSTKRTVSERNRHMFNNSDISDVSFTCEGSGKTFYAHKYVLATSSCVFHAMFYGVLAERESIVKLDDTDEKSLEDFLRFLYTDECTLTSENAVSVLYLAKKYMVGCLTEKCVDKLHKEMNAENVLSILEQAIYFDEKELEVECWYFIERHTGDMVSSESFNNISQMTLLTVLTRDKLTIPEVQLFQAVLKWSEVQCTQNNLSPTAENKRSVMGDAIYAIRFLSMNQQEFAQHVSTSGLFSNNELVPMFQKLHGVDSGGLRWTLLQREPPLTVKVTHEEVRFCRCTPLLRDAWQYDNWEPDRLCFSVSKDALFHGVSLFGSSDRGLYTVFLDVRGVKVLRIAYSSKGSKSSFDVMLESPIAIQANEVVTLTARIKGPASYMGFATRPTVEKNGVTVTFSDAPSPNHGTNALRGQFYHIILSI